MSLSLLAHFFALTLGVAPEARRDVAVICPPRVGTHQSSSAVPAGWEEYLEDDSHRLAWVTFYDGPPKLKASLAPDSTTKHGHLEVSQWKLPGGADGEVWLTCSYSRTIVTLAKKLDAKFTTCSVEYDSRAKLGGLHPVVAIHCF